MSTATIYAGKSARITAASVLFNDHTETIAVMSETTTRSMLLVGFDVPTEVRTKDLLSANLYFYVSASSVQPFEARVNSADFDETSITYNAFADKFSTDQVAKFSTDEVAWYQQAAWVSEPLSKIAKVLQYGVAVERISSTPYPSLSVHTSRATNKPYIVLTYQDATIYAKNCNPASGFADEREAIVFSWGLGTDANTIDKITQASAVFRWRPDSGSTATEIAIADGTQSYTMPAGTVTTDSFQWQVEITADTGATATSNWYTVSTVDSAATCTCTSPVDSYIDGSKPQSFAWSRNIATGTAQTAYDLQYSTDGSTWADLKTDSTANLYAVIPADTLPAGQLSWRVRSYNSDSVAGEWSDAAVIIVQSAPAAPSYNGVTNAARPTVSWQSVGQTAYQLQILSGSAVVYDTGTAAGTVKNHKVTDYLANGTYTAHLRVGNIYNLYSDWADYAFTISVTAPEAPTITGAAVDGGAQIICTNYSAYDTVYVLRDGVPVAKMTDRTWTDYGVIGEHGYRLRGVNASDCFADSAAVSVTVTVDTPQIATADALDAPLLLPYTRDGFRTIKNALAPNYTAYIVTGRAQPVVDFGEARQKTHSFNAALTAAEGATLAAMVGKTLCYRDQGDCFWAVITTLDWTRDWAGRDYSLTLAEVGHTDAIDYDD